MHGRKWTPADDAELAALTAARATREEYQRRLDRGWPAIAHRLWSTRKKRQAEADAEAEDGPPDFERIKIERQNAAYLAGLNRVYRRGSPLADDAPDAEPFSETLAVQIGRILKSRGDARQQSGAGCALA